MRYAEVQITCIRRYAKEFIDIPIFLATEVLPSDPIVARILQQQNVRFLSLPKAESDFLESRVAAFKYLPLEYDVVLPLQEDFWLDRRPDSRAIKEAIHYMETDDHVHSVRLMPSPGPHESDMPYKGNRLWRVLSSLDTYRFTFQATLWRRQPYIDFLQAIIDAGKAVYYESTYYENWSKFCVKVNIAENTKGQAIFKAVCMSGDAVHLSAQREHKGSNAVFLCPWPYRPTAVVQGQLEPWAKEFMGREGFHLPL